MVGVDRGAALHTLFMAAKSLVLRVETVAAASVIGFLLIGFDIDLGRGISMFYMGGWLAIYTNPQID